MWWTSRTIAEVFDRVRGQSAFRILIASQKKDDGFYWLWLTNAVVDVLVERELNGVFVSIGAAMSPPREFGKPGSLQGMFPWDDVRTALEDPDLPVRFGRSLEQALRAVCSSEERLNHLFADRSLSKLRLARHNRTSGWTRGDG
jgi:hypothetical protein